MNKLNLRHDQKDLENMVETLFQDVLGRNDLLLRPAMLPFDSLVPGTIVMIISREPDCAIEEIFCACDYETLTNLVSDHQRRVDSHVVRRDRFFMVVLNKDAWNERWLADKAKTFVAAA